MADQSKSVELNEYERDRIELAIDVKLKSLNRQAATNPMFKQVVDTELVEYNKILMKLKG